jgi:hypothetical protein
MLRCVPAGLVLHPEGFAVEGKAHGTRVVPWAICYAPNASLAQIAIAAGNSEAMIRKHYLGGWSLAMTQALWSLKTRIPAADAL